MWKVSKYGFISGPNTGKYGQEITPRLDTFHAWYFFNLSYGIFRFNLFFSDFGFRICFAPVPWRVVTTESRGSHLEVFCKKVVLKNFEKFTGKHLCQSIFSNYAAGVRPATLFKKRLWHWCFSVSFAKFLYRKPLVATSVSYYYLTIPLLINSFHADVPFLYTLKTSNGLTMSFIQLRC